MTDVFSLKFAIYFILPPVIFYVSAYACGRLLILLSQLVVDRDVPSDTATNAMAIVIASTTAVVLLIHSTTHAIWITMAAGSASFFVVGAIVYSRLIKDFSPRGPNGFTAPIGLLKGTAISAMLSLSVAASTLFVLWGARRDW